MKLNIRILLLGDHVTINIRSTVFTMKLEKIWFDVEMKKAMAKLVDEKDRCYSITSPAVKLVLTEANYMKQKALDLSAAGSPVNRAFNYVSALKRLVGISQSKRTMMNQDICLVSNVSLDTPCYCMSAVGTNASDVWQKRQTFRRNGGSKW